MHSAVAADSTGSKHSKEHSAEVASDDKIKAVFDRILAKTKDPSAGRLTQKERTIFGLVGFLRAYEKGNLTSIRKGYSRKRDIIAGLEHIGASHLASWLRGKEKKGAPLESREELERLILAYHASPKAKTGVQQDEIEKIRLAILRKASDSAGRLTGKDTSVLTLIAVLTVYEKKGFAFTKKKYSRNHTIVEALESIGAKGMVSSFKGKNKGEDVPAETSKKLRELILAYYKVPTQKQTKKLPTVVALVKQLERGLSPDAVVKILGAPNRRSNSTLTYTELDRNGNPRPFGTRVFVHFKADKYVSFSVKKGSEFGAGAVPQPADLEPKQTGAR
jgi:hypothetical protein